MPHAYVELVGAELVDRFGVAVGNLPLKCQCCGLVCVPDVGPEPSYANDDCAADADRGGCQGGIHAGSVRPACSVWAVHPPHPPRCRPNQQHPESPWTSRLPPRPLPGPRAVGARLLAVVHAAHATVSTKQATRAITRSSGIRRAPSPEEALLTAVFAFRADSGTVLGAGLADWRVRLAALRPVRASGAMSRRPDDFLTWQG